MTHARAVVTYTVRKWAAQTKNPNAGSRSRRTARCARRLTTVSRLSEHIRKSGHQEQHEHGAGGGEAPPEQAHAQGHAPPRIEHASGESRAAPECHAATEQNVNADAAEQRPDRGTITMSRWIDAERAGPGISGRERHP